MVISRPGSSWALFVQALTSREERPPDAGIDGIPWLGLSDCFVRLRVGRVLMHRAAPGGIHGFRGLQEGPPSVQTR